MAWGDPSGAELVTGLTGAGLIAGSFLTVVIHRLPLMLGLTGAQPQAVYNLAVPRSHCPACGAAVRVMDNVPVIGWLRLGGRCRTCKDRIPLLYPVVEGLAALVGMACALVAEDVTRAVALALFGWFALAITIIDLRYLVIPDRLSLALLWAGLVLSLVPAVQVESRQAILGAAVGYGGLWLVRAGAESILRRPALGGGDLKLFAAIGAWVGPVDLPGCLLLASLSGLVAAGLVRALRRPGGQVPFGPFLMLGACAPLVGLYPWNFGKSFLVSS